jgi:hypothetical protein
VHFEENVLMCSINPIQTEATDFYLLQSTQTKSGAHAACYSLGTGSPREVKWLRHDADHTCILIQMLRIPIYLRGLHGDKFTFYPRILIFIFSQIQILCVFQNHLKVSNVSFFFVALRPSAGHCLLILEVSRSHTTTHHTW